MSLPVMATNRLARTKEVMEPFSIICHSCAARLKVANPELIDQTLACPKCGSMIHVQHPTGWKPPIPESKGSLSALSSVVSGSDFDQIDDLLPKPGEPASLDKSKADPANGKSQAKPKSGKTRFQNSHPNAGATESPTRPSNATGNPSLKDQPILPGQQWASPSAQKRKKLMLMIGSAIGTVLVVAIAIAAIVRFDTETPIDDPSQVAVADNENEDPINSNDDPKQTDPAFEDPTPKPAAADDSTKFLDDGPTIMQLPIEQTNSLSGPPPIIAPDSDNSRFAAPVVGIVTPDSATNTPPVVDLDNKPAGNAASASKTKSLQEALATAGITVSELEDVALMLRSFEEARNPKFPMEKPKKKNLNFERLMSSPIRKLETPNGISFDASRPYAEPAVRRSDCR